MPIVRLRLTADADRANELIHAIEAIEGIERVEEVADLMPHMDDDDSSSAGLPDDASPGFHAIEVETPNEEGDRRVRLVAERFAEATGSAVEIVDEF